MTRNATEPERLKALLVEELGDQDSEVLEGRIEERLQPIVEGAAGKSLFIFLDPFGLSIPLELLVQGFQAEFASHVRRSCPLPRELPFHKLIDWDATTGRFTYDRAYADKQPDWTSRS